MIFCLELPVAWSTGEEAPETEAWFSALLVPAVCQAYSRKHRAKKVVDASCLSQALRLVKIIVSLLRLTKL